MVIKRFIILSLILFSLQKNLFAKALFDNKTIITDTIKDTIVESEKQEDKAIDEVLKSKSLPKQDKVQYFSQVTKYGFKDLFKNFTYNPSMPYSTQVNPYAENYMQDYLASHKVYLLKMKTTALPYFNLIDNILSQYGLPKELKYLAVIESNLNCNAVSYVGATGPWQFMSYTAKTYGLKINGYTDERTDYYKSTNAAARYLLSLYKDLKDWLLVIAAYNGGPGRVYGAIKKSGSRNFWSLQYYLPEESRNHVKKFIATHYIMESNTGSSEFDYAALNNSGLPFSSGQIISREDSLSTEVMNISGKFNSVVIAKNLTIDIDEFNRLNPGLDAALSSGEEYALRLPSDKMDLFVANKYPILNECVQTLLNDVNAAPTKTIYNRNKPASKKKN